MLMTAKIRISFYLKAMKLNIFLLFLTISFPSFCFSQYYDDFEDGNFTSNPQWFHSGIEPKIINSDKGYSVSLSFDKDISADVYDGSFRTASLLTDNTYWGTELEFVITGNSDDAVFFYITSLLPDLGRDINEGMYVRLDLSDGSISFCHEKQGNVKVLAKSGVGILAMGSNRLKCVVTSNSGNKVLVYSTLAGEELWRCETDETMDMSAASGIRIRSGNPDFRVILHSANCGDKPEMCDVIMPGDVVFSEIMSDPTPVVALPAVEWLELYNKTDSILHLEDCTLSSSAAIGTIVSGEIYPHDYTVLCSLESADSLSAITDNITIVSHMPALRNDGDTIRLYNVQNMAIAEMHYRPQWHEQGKQGGGWSLEKRDVESIIDDRRNWSSSEDPTGGTPGTLNSINCTVRDGAVPYVKSTGRVNDYSISVYFSKKMDTECDLMSMIEISGNELISACFADNRSDILNIYISDPLSCDYSTDISLSDFICYEGIGLQDTVIMVGKPTECGYMDVVINELMPYVSKGKDKFMEIYNNSEKFFELSDLQLCNHTENDSLKNIKSIVGSSCLFAPHSYAVISTGDSIPENLLGTSHSAVYIQTSFPSFASANGDIAICTKDSTVIDRVIYNQKWHHSLLRDMHNVSLERISPTGNSNSSDNWQSSSTLVGYHTAGRQNSQFFTKGNTDEYFSVKNRTLSSRLGFNDIVIEYSLPESGYMLTIDIYNRYGEFISRIHDNAILSFSGEIPWDGTSASGASLPVDIYVLHIQAFHPTGDRITKRFTVVVN